MDDFYLKEIEQVETKGVVKNPEWFYHGFDFGNEEEILSKGVLAKKYLDDFPIQNFGSNGKHYISVAKDINQSGGVLNLYKNIGPLMIVDNLNALKCQNKRLYQLFCFTRLPFRYAEWVDEYQVYSKILPDKFVGIECMVYEWAKSYDLYLLNRFRLMLEVMEEMNSQLPIYDFSREEDGIVHELDKDGFLELSKHMIYKR